MIISPIRVRGAPCLARYLSARVELRSDRSARVCWDHSGSTANQQGVGRSGPVYKLEYWRRENGPYNMRMVASIDGGGPSVLLENLTAGAAYDFNIKVASADGSFSEIEKGDFDLSGKVAAPTASAEELLDLQGLEIRVGVIRSVAPHPDADQLYVESVDVGEGEPRTIVSGLVKYCSAESLMNSKVTVLCNLKPRALRGVKSHGMLLCASNEDHTQVSPLSPPADAPPGERIFFSDPSQAAALPAGKQSTKLFEKLAPGFCVSSEGVGTFKGAPFLTSFGPCSSSIIGRIS